ncbi:porin [Marinobacter lipolyticus]|uniref:porin n=1 Tax=Marinobacter lipolyticus TaxID=209639 RepID=UPI003A949E1A
MRKQKRLVSSIALVVCGFSASGAFAQTAVSKLSADAPVSNVSADVYGQLNYGLLFGDTGDGSEHFIVDNDNSGSRIGAKLKGDLNDTDLVVGTHVELEYQQNASNRVTLEERSISGEFNERQLNLFVSGGFGTLSLGQGDGAANGNIERDLSGTKVISYTNPGLVGGGLEFLDDATETRVRLGAATSDQDFESRYSRVRYDLPALGVLEPSISQGIKDGDDVSEIGVRFSGQFAGKISGALGYSIKDSGGQTGDVETLGGSLSWLHDSGINVTGAYSTSSDDDDANPDSDFYLAKLGYIIGKHAFDIHYAEAEDRVQKGDSAESVGVGYVFTPIKWFEAYAGYNNHSLERQGADFDDVDTVLVGGRLKF